MSVTCPHCQVPVPSDLTTAEDLVCPACGSSFRLGSGTTTGWNEPRRTLGKFELVELVGAGAFGSVYKARDKELVRTVAIKIPRQGGTGRT